MMIHPIKLRFFIITTLFFNLAACTIPGVKEQAEESPNIDLIEVEKQADTAYLNDDLVASERNYLILVKEIPEIPLHWFRLGNIYVRTNRPLAAVSMYREAVLRDPKYAKAWYNLSIVQLKQTAYSLNEMLVYTEESDPLYKKAKGMLDGIQTIIQQD